METFSSERDPLILVADKNDLARFLIHLKQKDNNEKFNPLKFRFYNIGKDFQALKTDIKELVLPLLGSELEVILETISVLIETEFTWYSTDEAKKLFRFEPEPQPVSGRFYCKHPLCKNCYIPVASTNTYLAREKIFRFSELAACLGAKEILVNVDDISTEKTKSSVSWKELATQIGINFASQSDFSTSIKVFKKYEKPRKRSLPQKIEDIPLELKPWLDHEVMFESMAIERINYGLLEQEVTIDIKTMVNIDSKLVSNFLTYGVDMGGNYEKLAESNWKFQVEYWSN